MTRLAVALALLVPLASCQGPRCPPAGAPADAVYPEKDRAAEAARLLAGAGWDRHAVFYEVNVRSFQDSDGDGVGDLRGLASRLDDLRALGVDALWLMPILVSPLADSGYDVADYEAVHPDYGTMADFEALLAAVHARGMRLFMDLVLNHTSSQHPWFAESRASRENPKADWYVWSDAPGREDIGCGPMPTFGDSAWTYEPARGQYYFHRFYPDQPDLNYRNPEVVAATLDVARFWLEKGVDGFRCDVIGLLVETAAGCDMTAETADYIRALRRTLDAYPNRSMVAEYFGLGTAGAAYFGDGTDMFPMAFDYVFGTSWASYLEKGDAQRIIDRFELIGGAYPAGAQDALFIGNHDQPRTWTRAAGVESRLRRGALLQLTMPGTPFLYYGEELGLRPGTQTVVDRRDAARTPMPWSDGPGLGFTTGRPWLAFGADAEETTWAAESADPNSTWSYYRDLLALRRGREAFGAGALRFLPTDTPEVLLYERASADESYLVAVSLDEAADRCAVAETADLPGEPQLLFGEATLARDGKVARVSVPAGGSAVFRVK